VKAGSSPTTSLRFAEKKKANCAANPDAALGCGPVISFAKPARYNLNLEDGTSFEHRALIIRKIPSRF
jgi:hypothetical protein